VSTTTTTLVSEELDGALHRALVQFKLTESIEAHEADIRHINTKMVELEK
jgi:hypothetical protein